MSESPYVKDPLNPTDAELSAAIQCGLDNGTLITVEDFKRHIEEPDAARRTPDLDREPEIGE